MRNIPNLLCIWRLINDSVVISRLLLFVDAGVRMCFMCRHLNGRMPCSVLVLGNVMFLSVASLTLAYDCNPSKPTAFSHQCLIIGINRDLEWDIYRLYACHLLINCINQLNVSFLQRNEFFYKMDAKLHEHFFMFTATDASSNNLNITLELVMLSLKLSVKGLKFKADQAAFRKVYLN